MRELYRAPLPDGSSESFAKRSVRFVARKAAPLLLVSLAACGGGEKNSDFVQPQSATRPSESGPINPENPFAVLEMPFPKNKDMTIQQGWQYTELTTQDGKKEHNGIDYIKGQVNNSRTWESFPVLAVADGKACANPPSRQGNAVIITHSVGEAPIGSTYYGHLEKPEKDIPACSTGETISKRKGDKIGDAGSTGTQDQSWIHLHFQVNDAKGNPIDPYDLKGERGIYPKPDFSDIKEKPCGPEALFIDCYPKGAVVAGPKPPIPPISGSVKEKSANPVSNVEKPLEKGWQTFKSTVLPYEVQYPSSWKTESYVGSSETGDTFRQYEENDRGFSFSITAIPIDPKTSIDNYVKNDIDGYRKNWKDSLLDGKDIAVDVKKRLIAGFNGQVVKIDVPPNRTANSANGFSFTRIFFLDGSQTLWIIGLGHGDEDVSKTDRELILNRFLDSFKLTTSPAETKKSAVEKKISISKKPDELFRALLTNLISPDILPQGISSKGTSAGEIDATGKALKEIGTVTIAIEDSVSQAVKGYPNGVIFYGIFPDSSTSKSASEIIGTNLQNGRDLKDFPYPAKVYTTESFFGVVIKTIVMSVENVTVAVSITGTDTDILESRAISLSQAAITHLGKVGK